MKQQIPIGKFQINIGGKDPKLYNQFYFLNFRKTIVPIFNLLLISMVPP